MLISEIGHIDNVRWLGYVGLLLVAVSGIIISLLFLQYLQYQQSLDANIRSAEECYATHTGYGDAMCGRAGAQTHAIITREQDNLYPPILGSIIFIGIGISIFVAGYKRPSWSDVISSKFRK